MNVKIETNCDKVLQLQHDPYFQKTLFIHSLFSFCKVPKTKVYFFKGVVRINMQITLLNLHLYGVHVFSVLNQHFTLEAVCSDHTHTFALTHANK